MYTHTNFGQLKTRLAERLGDPTNAFYGSDECAAYLIEALRIWGSITGYWRERGTFSTVSGTSHYDLQTLLLSGATKLLDQSVTDHQIIKDMQYHFLEPVSSQSVWPGTDMFTLDDLRYALQRSRDQFLVDSGCVLTRSTWNMPPPPAAVISLDDKIIDVRRAVWRDSAVVPYLLWRTDTWQETSISAAWNIETGNPEDWMLNDTRPVEIRVSPPPNDSGTLELVTVNAGPALDPATAATPIGLPDSLAWAAKWGAISDLLSGEAQSSDPQRAQFARQLYALGVEIATKLPTVTYSEINGIPGFPCSLADIDAAYQNWQAETPTIPEDVGVIGSNLVFLRPVPDNVYSVVLDVVRNAPIPTGDGDPVQVGLEELNAILDLAQVLAAFKQGGQEFSDSLTQSQDAFRAARVYVRRMNANILTLDTLAGLARREDVLRPRIAAEVQA